MRRRLLGALLPISGSLASLACGALDSGNESIAELRHATGQVDRDYADKPERWFDAVPGQTFASGEGVRTGTRSSASIGFLAGGGLSLASETTVRFFSGSPLRERRVLIETGEAELDGPPIGFRFSTLIGDATIDSGGRARIARRGDAVSLDLLAGTGRFTPKRGPPVGLRAGETLSANPDRVRVNGDRPRSRTTQVRAYGAGAEARELGAEWRNIHAGSSTLAEGTELRIPRGTSVAVADGGISVEGPAEVVLLTSVDAAIECRWGRLRAAAGEGRHGVRVPGGLVSLSEDDSRAEIDVDRQGHAEVAAPEGPVELKGRVRSATIAFGETGRLMRDGVIQLPDRRAIKPEVSILAGESPTIHDPRGRAAVEIRLHGVCPQGGAIEVAGAARRGREGATVQISPGAHPYEIRCRGQRDRRALPGGVIKVRRDSGLVRLPRSPAKNEMNADGRNYTVLYQNLVPTMIFEWRAAPPGDGFSFHLDSDRPPSRRVVTKGARYRAPSGTIREGRYRWWFETRRPHHLRSPESGLVVDFDNAAPQAFVKSPGDGAIVAGTSVRVAGVAIEGARVSVDGAPLALDRHQRFEANVPVDASRDAIAIRIEHPRGGIHYYLRRLRRRTP